GPHDRCICPQIVSRGRRGLERIVALRRGWIRARLLCLDCGAHQGRGHGAGRETCVAENGTPTDKWPLDGATCHRITDPPPVSATTIARHEGRKLHASTKACEKRSHNP